MKGRRSYSCGFALLMRVRLVAYPLAILGFFFEFLWFLFSTCCEL